MMKINVTEILKNEGSLKSIVFEDELDAIKFNHSECKVDQGICFNGQVVNNAGVLALTGNVLVKYTTKCGRCLKELSGELDIRISEEYIVAEIPDDESKESFDKNFIYLDKVLSDNILLNLPNKQLCEEECKGLCQRCGNDLNMKACHCEKEETNPQMDKLKDYFNH